MEESRYTEEEWIQRMKEAFIALQGKLKSADYTCIGKLYHGFELLKKKESPSEEGD